MRLRRACSVASASCEMFLSRMCRVRRWDPDQPPATLDEVKADAQKIVASGAAKYGIALKTDSWLIEHWLGKANQTLVNNGNGRKTRATKVTFDSPTTVRLFTWIDDINSTVVGLSSRFPFNWPPLTSICPNCR